LTLESSCAAQTGSLSKNQIEAMQAGAVYCCYDTEDYGDYIIGCEKLRDFFVEYRNFLYEQRKVVEPFIEDSAVIDHQAVFAMEAAHKFVVFTVRHAGEIVGTSGFGLMNDMSAAGQQTASDHGFFLREEHRKGRLAFKFLSYAEDSLKKLGVSGVYMGDKSPVGAPDLSKFFKRAGYSMVSRAFLKRF